MTLGSLIIATLASAITVKAATLPTLISRSGTIKSETIPLRDLDTRHQYSILYSVESLRDLEPSSMVTIEIVQGSSVLGSKTLHSGDPDFYTHVRAPRAGDAELRVISKDVKGTYSLQVNRWLLSQTVRSGPIHRWEDAMLISLGTTVFASGDDSAYIPLPGTTRRANTEDSKRTDWYRFEFREPSTKLVFFQVELTERDQIPADVSIYRRDGDKLAGYFEGEDPVTLPHEVQALPGNKFTPRILKERGTYYIAVRASHPEYKLRTRLYDSPPYTDPQKAVRTAVDYIIAAGDSWHANIPRRGGILDRVESVHQETSLCVACHPTHFSQRAQLYATRNGYPVVNRQQLQFLTERFYNNPRPSTDLKNRVPFGLA